MKNLGKVLFRQRIKLDDYLIGGIEILRKLLQVLLGSEPEGSDAETPEESLDKKYYLPFYWEDMFEVYSNLKKIFAILQTYSAEKRIYQSRLSFSHFLELEDRILGNVKCFIEAYLSNRKYAEELLKNNRHELQNYVRLYYHGIASIGRQQAQSHITSRLLEVLLEINAVNNIIQDLLQKILIGTNL
jgi:hypothetical protein